MKTKIVFGAALRCPADVVVLGGDRRRTSPIGDSCVPAVERSTAGVAADRLDAVVVAVLVGDEQQVGLTPSIAG